jgi:precorrin isomerase
VGIERFGSEAEGSSRSALRSAFRTYTDALADQRFEVACDYLSNRVQDVLTDLFRRPAGAEGSCMSALPKVLSPEAPAFTRAQANGDVVKIRVSGSQAFVIYRAPGAELYQLTMVREGGRWRAATVIGSILVPSRATLAG